MDSVLENSINNSNDQATQIPQGQNLKKSSNMKIVLIVLLVLFSPAIIYWIVNVVMMFASFISIFSSSSPSTERYRSYLENKYGSSEGFSYVRDGNSSDFDGGYSTQIFTSEKTDQEFKVTYRTFEKVFSDDYWMARNYSELSSHYRGMIDEVFHYDYNLSLNGRHENEEVEPYVTAQDLLNSDDFIIYIDIDSSYRNISDYEDLDTEYIESFLSDLADKGMIPEVESINLIIDMDGSGYTRCPMEGVTSYSTRDGLVECSKTLYDSRKKM